MGSNNPTVPTIQDLLNMQGGSAGPMSSAAQKQATQGLNTYLNQDYAKAQAQQAAFDAANPYGGGLGSQYQGVPWTHPQVPSFAGGAGSPPPPEGVIPFDPSAIGVTSYSGASPAELQAQLQSQIAGLQAAGNRAGGQVGSLYANLAKQLSGYIPAEDKAYDSTIGQIGGLFSGLDNSITGTYGNQVRGISDELNRLGQGNRISGETNQLGTDEDFLRGLSGILGSGALSSEQMLKQGAHTYNQDVVGMAKTESANRRADIMQAVLSQIANARNSAASKIASAKSNVKTTNPSSIEELLTQLHNAKGGDAQWADKAQAAISAYLHSKQAQQGGMYLNVGSKVDSSGNKSDVGQFRPENAETMARYLVGQLQQGLNNPENTARAQQLADLLSQMYFGKKTYAGS